MRQDDSGEMSFSVKEGGVLTHSWVILGEPHMLAEPYFPPYKIGKLLLPHRICMRIKGKGLCGRH